MLCIAQIFFSWLQRMDQERRQIIKELFKPARINFPRRRYEIRSINDVFQLDVAEMQLFKDQNRGYSYFLLGVNPFTKMIYGEILRTKTAREVAEATKKILEKTKIRFRHLMTDKGTEFLNAIFRREIVNANNLHHYVSNSIKKCAHVERAIGTIKRAIHKEIAMRKSENWIDNFQRIIDIRNDTPHSRLKIKPKNINRRNEGQIYRKFYGTQRRIVNPKFAIGEKVRIELSAEEKFRKSFFPSWSPAVFTIIAVNRKYPCTYKLKNFGNIELARSYYEEELQRVKYPDIWLVDKVVGRRGNMRKVRWLGLEDPRYDTWVHKDDIED